MGRLTKIRTQKVDRTKVWLAKAEEASGSGSIESRMVQLMEWIGKTLRSVNPPIPTRNPLDILDSGIGWCDQQVKVFLWLVGKLWDCPGREVMLVHSDGVNGHTIAEVYYRSKWHLFDVHSDHQAYYRDPSTGEVLGYLEVCENVQLVLEEAHGWRGNNGEGKEGFYSTARLWPGISSLNGPGAAYCDYHLDEWT